VHLAALHQYGSTNPLGIQAQTDLIDFYRAPLCFFLSLFLYKNQYSCIYTNLGLVYTVKHIPGMTGQPLVLSWSKRHMSSGGKSKKYRLANTGMAKLMNLHNNPSGLVEPLMPFLLMHFGCHGFVLGRDTNLYTVDITPFYQKSQGLQEPKPVCWGNRRTMVWPMPK
jgi:hypothetical protein